MGLSLTERQQKIHHAATAYRKLWHQGQENFNGVDLYDENPNCGYLPYLMKSDSAKYGILQLGAVPLIEYIGSEGESLIEKFALDLGCSIGVMLYILATEYGMHVSGIDMDIHAILRANQVLELLGVMNAKAFWGNALHPEYRGVSRKIKWGEKKKKFWTPPSIRPFTEDVYERLPLRLEEYDFFYMYQYDDNTAHFVHMLSQMAKSGAFILVAGPSHLESSLRFTKKKLPSNTELLMKNDNASLLRIR